jgi:5-methylcytosine-specific restriction protein A
MPSRLKKRCGFRGCRNTTTERYCPEHLPLARRAVDARRGSTQERGYDADWRRLAEVRRSLDCGLCQHCLALGRLVPSNIVDHILPVHVRPDWRLEIGNTQVLCRVCHTHKTSADNVKYGGPSCNPTAKQCQNRKMAMDISTPLRNEEVSQHNDVSLY